MEKNLFTKQQELQILKAFDDIDKDLGIDKLDDEAGLKRIFQKFPETGSRTRAPKGEAQNTGLSSKDENSNEASRRALLERSFGWKSISASIVSAFSLGVIVANFALVPTVAISTRGINTETPGGPVLKDQDQFKVINLDGIDRHVLVNQVLISAYQSDLLVTIQQRNERLILRVGDFRPLSKNQEKVRELLQLGNSFSGHIEVEIK